ncbi:DUF2007 domain-containing protein [Ancylomarina sp.]|uniref:putative signal transducing protein n=1 Tax=Ancylomarina sp. TaxID=1970196 RepID=UPI00356946D5
MSTKKIFSGISPVVIMGVKNLLESEGIECFEINKSDSSYVGLLGEIELYVDESQVEKAQNVLKTFKSE